MGTRKLFIFIFILLSLPHCGLEASTLPIVRKHLGVSNGLPDGTVKCFAEDPDGFIWMGTFNGLAQYDGYGFRVFRHTDQPTSIIHNHVESLLSENGKLWIGTYNGLDCYPFEENTFLHCVLESNDGKTARRMEGKVLGICMIDGQIFAINNNTVVKLKHGTTFTTFQPLKGQKCYGLASYGHKLLASTSDRIYLIDIKKNKIISSCAIDGNSDFQIDYDETLHTAFANSGLNHPCMAFTIDSRMQIHATKTPYLIGVKKTLPTKWGTAFATDGGGLLFLNHDGQHRLTMETDNLCSNAIHSLFNDSHGNLWVGSYREGLDVLGNMDRHIRTFTYKANQLSWPIVTSIEQHGGKYYVGTDGGGLNVIDGKGNILRTYTTANSGIGGNNVVSLASDDNHLYIASYVNGLTVLDFATGRLYRPIFPNDVNDVLNTVWQILDDGKGHLWIGCGNGIVVWDKVRQTTAIIRDKGLWVRGMSMDAGVLWVTAPQAIYKIDMLKRRVVKKFPGIGDDLRAICVDSSHKVWFAQHYNGLWILDEDTGKAHQKGAEQDLLRNINVTTMCRDDKGRMWIGTDNGFFCYLPQRDNFVDFLHYEDMALTQVVENSIHHSDGIVYMGATKGFFCFNADDMPNSYKTGATHFIGLTTTADNQFFHISGAHPDGITLRHNQNFFSITFATSDILKAKDMRFRYRLHDFDKTWLELNGSNEVSYTGVPLGRYEFEVMAVGRNGEEGPRSVLSIVVSPPWWNSWWANLLWVFIGIAIAVIIIRSYIRIQQSQQKIKEKEHEKELVEKTNEEKLNFFANITHELRTPMFLITAPLEELMASPHRPVPVPFTYLRRMYHNAIRLNRLINMVLDIRKLDNGRLNLLAAHHDLGKLCRRVATDYRNILSQKDISFELDIDRESLPMDYDREKLELILSNLIANAFKYTNEHGRVTMIVRDLGDKVQISVKDDGVGIGKDEQDKIFDRYYRANGAEMKTGDGIGLSFVKSLVELHHGTITVESESGEGACFTVVLPKHQEVRVGTSPAIRGLNACDIERQMATSEEQSNGIGLENVSPQSPMAVHTILVIDDNADIRQMLEHYLTDRYKVMSATDGEEGLAVARETMPDLIICDMMMPKMDGLQFLHEIKNSKQLATTPVIMLTAKLQENDRITAFEQGADAYLTKPVSLKMLRTRIGQLLEARRRKREEMAIEPIKSEEVDEAAQTATQGDSRKKSYNREEQKFILLCQEIVEKNLTNERLGVEMLADELHISHSSLYKKIKQMTGKSASDFIMEYRIFKAVQLFREGESNVGNVARLCGFKDDRAFRDAFKKRMGVSPKSFIMQI
jgi:signal transduction histidine kinase/DNA-binding response OmpR family regulator/ligand-binding sensor domain-containing protein